MDFFWLVIILFIGAAIIKGLADADSGETTSASITNAGGRSMGIMMGNPDMDALKSFLHGSDFATGHCKEEHLSRILSIMAKAGYEPVSAPAQMGQAEENKTITVRVMQTFKIAEKIDGG